MLPRRVGLVLAERSGTLAGSSRALTASASTATATPTTPAPSSTSSSSERDQLRTQYNDELRRNRVAMIERVRARQEEEARLKAYFQAKSENQTNTARMRRDKYDEEAKERRRLKALGQLPSLKAQKLATALDRPLEPMPSVRRVLIEQYKKKVDLESKAAFLAKELKSWGQNPFSEEAFKAREANADACDAMEAEEVVPGLGGPVPKELNVLGIQQSARDLAEFLTSVPGRQGLSPEDKKVVDVTNALALSSGLLPRDSRRWSAQTRELVRARTIELADESAKLGSFNDHLKGIRRQLSKKSNDEATIKKLVKEERLLVEAVAKQGKIVEQLKATLIADRTHTSVQTQVVGVRRINTHATSPLERADPPVHPVNAPFLPVLPKRLPRQASKFQDPVRVDPLMFVESEIFGLPDERYGPFREKAFKASLRLGDEMAVVQEALGSEGVQGFLEELDISSGGSDASSEEEMAGMPETKQEVKQMKASGGKAKKGK